MLVLMGLARFLERYHADAEDTVVWGGMPLRAAMYLTGDLPPEESITSARGLVFHEGKVLVVRHEEGFHLLPGGRRQAGESLEETLRREVLEETRWLVETERQLGFIHFRHLNPRPADYPHPYPEFVHVVYQARAVACVPDAILIGDFALDVSLQLPREALRLSLPERDRLLLGAALSSSALP